jgi:hypothetical protein
MQAVTPESSYRPVILTDEPERSHYVLMMPIFDESEGLIYRIELWTEDDQHVDALLAKCARRIRGGNRRISWPECHVAPAHAGARRHRRAGAPHAKNIIRNGGGFSLKREGWIPKPRRQADDDRGRSFKPSVERISPMRRRSCWPVRDRGKN